MKKHRRQMSKAEVDAGELFVHSQTFSQPSYHAAARMSLRGFGLFALEETLRLGKLVEVNKTDRSVRGLVRHSFGKQDVCVVFSFNDLAIITAWVNCSTDTHQSLDLNRYRWKVDVRNLVQKFANNTGHINAQYAINGE